VISIPSLAHIRHHQKFSIKGHDDKSVGIEILIVDAFAKINPTDPIRLAKQAREGSEIDLIPR
jgi:hypothetical protein